MPDAHATLEAVSDEALARRIADGPPGTTDAEEGELYRRFAPRVRLYGRRHLRSDAAADDLAQNVLLRTIERLHAGDVRRPEEIGSFILGTSRMMAHGERRIERRREALTARFMDAAGETAPSSMSAIDAPRVAACLNTLPERERLVLLLTFYAERDAPGIADDLGVSPGAIRVIRHRAIARLRACVLTATEKHRKTQKNTDLGAVGEREERS
ncbi:MAG TPA: sigma-70 family RNA polymerase sigma factor [Vicinamibacterales bacterium]|nr:sigma-70 family RNA polymerase sigma factor [Vicinamibacterales bacterium]